MPETSKVKHPYPSQNEDPWFASFESMLASIDAADFAARDERNLILSGGGNITFSSSGDVSWTNDLTIHHASTGYQGTLAANPGGTSLDDGQLLYIDLVRGPQQNYTTNAVKTSGNLPNNDKAVVLFYRDGNTLWVRDFGSVTLGGSLSQTENAIVAGDDIYTPRTLSTNETQGEGLAVIGRLRLNIDDHALQKAASTDLYLRVEAQVAVDGQEADVELYDVTGGGGTLLEHYDVNSDQAQQFRTQIPPVDTTTERVYELRAGMDPAGAPYAGGEVITVWSGELEVINSF